jgi:hypothetical protein
MKHAAQKRSFLDSRVYPQETPLDLHTLCGDTPCTSENKRKIRKVVMSSSLLSIMVMLFVLYILHAPRQYYC